MSDIQVTRLENGNRVLVRLGPKTKQRFTLVQKVEGKAVVSIGDEKSIEIACEPEEAVDIHPLGETDDGGLYLLIQASKPGPSMLGEVLGCGERVTDVTGVVVVDAMDDAHAYIKPDDKDGVGLADMLPNNVDVTRYPRPRYRFRIAIHAVELETKPV